MGTESIALERVQALLKIHTADGSVHDHLARLVRRLAEGQSPDALAQLEKLSRHVKKSSFKGVPSPDEKASVQADADAEKKLLEWCSATTQLVRPPSTSVLGTVRNFYEDAAMFAWAGIGFGREESYAITMSLRRLAADTPSIESVRFWGKILGTSNDYYIAEASLKLPPLPPLEKRAPPPLPEDPEYDVEPRGQGVNTFMYWVSAGPSTPWTPLPAARASHIKAAKSIKRLMVGDLDSPVLSTPWFPGKERHLLRAQIARISASCNLAVSGWYAIDEDENAPKNKLKVAEADVAFDSLGEQATWVHAAAPLLPNGKTTLLDLDLIMEKYGTSDDDPPGKITEAYKTKLEAFKEEESKGAEEVPEILSDISKDSIELLGEAGGDASPAWSIKTHGDEVKYTFGDGERSYAVTSLRSLLWPGAATVARGTTFANLYVGYGMKCGSLVPQGDQPLSGTCAFTPLVPGDVMEEPEDLQEEPEPNERVQEQESDGEGEVDEDDQA
jgi:hypothetical protein